MSAFRPSCSSVDRSIGPVNLIALAIRSSSSVTVVRISFLLRDASTLASLDANVDCSARKYFRSSPMALEGVANARAADCFRCRVRMQDGRFLFAADRATMAASSDPGKPRCRRSRRSLQNSPGHDFIKLWPVDSLRPSVPVCGERAWRRRSGRHHGYQTFPTSQANKAPTSQNRRQGAPVRAP